MEGNHIHSNCVGLFVTSTARGRLNKVMTNNRVQGNKEKDIRRD